MARWCCTPRPKPPPAGRWRREKRRPDRARRAQSPLHLHISDDELARGCAAWTPPEPPLASGYWKLYIDHVLQADEGVDLDFLVGKRGAFVPKDNH